MRFKILYIIFIIICVLYPYKLIVGPISIRHIMSLTILAVSVYEGFRSDRYLYLYFIFLFCLLFSSLITGYLGIFFNKLLGTYMPIIAAYAATYTLIKKYNGANVLLWLFVTIGLLDSVVTIGQFFHLGYVDTIFNLFRFDYNEDFFDLSGRRQSLEGFAIPGLLDTVTNGYFLSAIAIMVLYNKNCNFIINIALWVVVMIASLLTQERTGFFLALIFSAYILGNFFFSKGKVAGYLFTGISVLVISLLCFKYMGLLFDSDLRFAKGFDTDNRDELRSGAWDYILSNPFGGFYEFDESGNRSPHNFFVNAFLYGGFIGGLSIIVLLFKQIKQIIPFLFSLNKTEDKQWAFLYGLLYIDYSLNSMLHNASIISGAFLFFVWWGAFLAFAGKDKPQFKIVKNKIS